MRIYKKHIHNKMLIMNDECLHVPATVPGYFATHMPIAANSSDGLHYQAHLDGAENLLFCI